MIFQLNNKPFGQAFIDYLRPTYYDSMPLGLKQILYNIKNHNTKCLLYKYIYLIE